MNTEAPVLRIRRAQVLDAVNILRLVVDEEKRARVESALDDATRLTDIIAAIATGYVSVAVLSGRVVGTIGALVSDLSGSPVLVGTFFALSPSLHSSEVGRHLVSGLVKHSNGLPVKFTLPQASIGYPEWLSDLGFSARAITWGLKPGDALEQEDDENAADSTETEPELPDVGEVLDSGRDGFAGPGGDDDVADGDAVPDFAAARTLASGDRDERDTPA